MSYLIIFYFLINLLIAGNTFYECIRWQKVLYLTDVIIILWLLLFGIPTVGYNLVLLAADIIFDQIDHIVVWSKKEQGD